MYLHNHHIIYRDLKSENVLVWAIPTSADARPTAPVLVKLADYGISQSVDMHAGTKGFGGTPPFIAPEILQHAGKDTYTEKVRFQKHTFLRVFFVFFFVVFFCFFVCCVVCVLCCVCVVCGVLCVVCMYVVCGVCMYVVCVLCCVCGV